MTSAKKNTHRHVPGETQCRRTRTVATCFLLLLSIMALPATVMANSPKDVALSYDRDKHILEVRITHPSSSPSFHYISKVEIKKNGQATIVKEYKNQPQQDTFTYSYPMEIGPGDVVEAKATCSIFGSKTGKLDMSKAPR